MQDKDLITKPISRISMPIRIYENKGENFRNLPLAWSKICFVVGKGALLWFIYYLIEAQKVEKIGE